MNEIYIGLMSGTSADGVNAALVDLSENKPVLVGTVYHPFPPPIRHAILALYEPGPDEINRLGELDVVLGKIFANAVLELLQKTNISKENVRAIGSHGQTIRHHPQKTHPFTLQITDPNVIAAETGIITVADFRRRDVALGGQGAPLVPAFHQAIFADEKQNRVIVNIGGIANISVLANNSPILGYDTGPGNALLDAWIEKHLQQSYDKNGAWASQGIMQAALLKTLLQDPYFTKPFPKSTGREYFHLAWLEKHITQTYSPLDVQRTIVELTAITIAAAIKHHFQTAEVFICGGGVHNTFLMERLKALLPEYLLQSTHAFGVDPDWVEAMAFAWLAQQTLQKKSGNIASVTGARSNCILGGIFEA